MLAALAILTTPPALFHRWKIAFVRDDNLWIARGDGSGAHLLAKNGTQPHWSVDHRKIVFIRNRSIFIIDPASRATKRVFTAQKDEDVVSLTWGAHVFLNRWEADTKLPAGSSIVASVRGRQGRGRLVAIRVGGAQASVQDLDIGGMTGFDLSGYGGVAWSRNGSRLVYTMNGDIWNAQENVSTDPNGASGWDVFRLAAIASFDSPTYRLDRSAEFAVNLALSANGNLVAYDYQVNGIKQPEVLLLDVRSQGFERGPPPTQKSSLLMEMASDPCFSPDDNWVLVTAYEEGFRRLQAISVTGHKRVQLIAGSEGVW